jgi:integrase
MAYKMPSGKYRAERIIHGHRKTATFPTLRDARKWEAEQNEDTLLLARSEIVTALQAADMYMAEVEQRMVRKTFIEKESLFKLLFKSIKPLTDIEKITPKDAARFLNAQFAERGGNAANGDRKNLCAWWTWATDTLQIEAKNPFSRIKRFPEVRTARRVPSIEELGKVLEVAQGETWTFLFTLLNTGARAGELFKMKWSDLDLDKREVTLWTRKRRDGTLESDRLPMTDELHSALLQHRAKARSVFVFCRQDGQPFTERIRLMDGLCAKAGVEKFGFHGLRHLCASMLDRAGKPLAIIQLMLRHKSATTTAKYLHSLGCVRVELGNVFSLDEKRPTAVQRREPGERETTHGQHMG